MSASRSLRWALVVSLLAHLLLLLCLLPLHGPAPQPVLQVELQPAPLAGPRGVSSASRRMVARQAQAKSPRPAPAALSSSQQPASLPSSPPGLVAGAPSAPTAPAAVAGTGQAPQAGNGAAAGSGGAGAKVLAARYLGDAQHPPYPERARARGEEGRVEAVVVVAADGRVREVTLLRSSGVDELDQAALALLRQGPYAPAQRAGTPIDSKLRMAVPFRLDQ